MKKTFICITSFIQGVYEDSTNCYLLSEECYVLRVFLSVIHVRLEMNTITFFKYIQIN